MASKAGMYWATHESVIVPVGRDRKIRTALRTTNQIAGFVTVPSKKKKKRFSYIHSHFIIKLITPWSPAFFRTSDSQLVVTLNTHWLYVIFSIALIG